MIPYFLSNFFFSFLHSCLVYTVQLHRVGQMLQNKPGNVSDENVSKSHFITVL